MKRRTFIASGAVLASGALTGMPSAFAQGKPEQSKVAIAVGGKNLFYYLPLTIAEKRNYFKDEGLDVEISDFAGGAKALQAAAVGGSADVVSGAFEHTLLLQAKKELVLPRIRAAGTRAADRARGFEEGDAELQVARRPEGQEDRRDGAGIVHLDHGVVRVREGRPQADRCLVHRRGSGRDRRARIRPDRRHRQSRFGDDQARSRGRNPHHLRHAHADRYENRVQRQHARGLPVRGAKFHHEESEHDAGPH